MAASTPTSSVPTQYMSGRGRYWSVISNPSWPGLSAVRLDANGKDKDASAPPMMAPDFAGLATAIETFETEEAKKGGAIAKADEKKDAPMADSTKLLLWGLGISVVGVGAYMLLKPKAQPAY